MNIEKECNGAAITLKVSGRLDTTTAPALETAVSEKIGSCDQLIMDFANLEYISSAGLRVLLSAQKTMNKQGTMKVLHANEMILEIFEVTGFADILTIE